MSGEIEDYGVKEVTPNENPDVKPEQKTAEQPRLDSKAVANQIVGQVLQGLRAANVAGQSRQPERVSPLTDWAQRQLDRGVPPSAVKEMLEGFQAAKEEEAVRSEPARREHAYKTFQGQLWQMVFDDLKSISESPGLTEEQAEVFDDAHDGICKKIQKAVNTDPDFSDILEKVNRGELPTKKEMSKVTSKVVNRFFAATGIERPALPPSARSQKPAQNTRASDPFANLDSNQRKALNAFRNAGVPEEELLALVREM